MELSYFQDKLFDILNDSEEMDICNIIADSQRRRFAIYIADGSVFEIECRSADGNRPLWKGAPGGSGWGLRSRSEHTK